MCVYVGIRGRRGVAESRWRREREERKIDGENERWRRSKVG